MESETASHSALIACLLEMGELLLGCGAEISRIEDTLQRLGKAYGAERMDVFVIPSLISVTLSFPGNEAVTETRRIRSSGGNDFYRLEKLNDLSRRCCAARSSTPMFLTTSRSSSSRRTCSAAPAPASPSAWRCSTNTASGPRMRWSP